jgi:hypothetical protein
MRTPLCTCSSAGANHQHARQHPRRALRMDSHCPCAQLGERRALLLLLHARQLVIFYIGRLPKVFFLGFFYSNTATGARGVLERPNAQILSYTVEATASPGAGTTNGRDCCWRRHCWLRDGTLPARVRWRRHSHHDRRRRWCCGVRLGQSW